MCRCGVRICTSSGPILIDSVWAPFGESAKFDMKEGPARVCRASRSLAILEDHPTMAEFMWDAGYVTGMIGKWDIGSREQGPLDCGFMEVARSAPNKKLFIIG